MKRLFAAALVLCLLLSFPAAEAASGAAVFSDVSSGDWFYSSVDFVTKNGMFSGTSSATFSPADVMTRGMFVTVLGRYGGVSVVDNSGNMGIVTRTDVNMRSLPTTSGSSILATLQKNAYLEVYDLIPDSSDTGFTWYYVKYNGILGYIRSDLMDAILNDFTDVADNAYYKPYVIWACSSFIASKTGSTTFSPDRAITREEICSMLFNFASLKNVKLQPTVSAKTFSDSSSISTDYREAVLALQQAGVINGYDDGSFRPGGSATRAEVSTMLMRFVNAISYHPSDEPSTDGNGNYVFGTEVPQAPSVGASYFSDACFIGHSLIVGMQSYSGLTGADYYAVNGASSQYILNYEGFTLNTTHTDESGKTVSDKGGLDKALSENSYGKVYIMLGVNEIGSASYHQQSFYNNMSTLINLVRKSQPNATIYLISITPVSQKCSESREDINRDNIIAFNGVIKQLCKDKKAYYLNAFDLLADSDGFLPQDACMTDGIHILAAQYRQLKDYICAHTVQ